MSNQEPAHGRGSGPECQVCPICMGLSALWQARPEAMEHLLKAGAELLLAARALLEAGEAAGPSRQPAGMQRIRVG